MDGLSNEHLAITIGCLNKEIEQLRRQLAEKDQQLAEKDQQLAEKDQQLAEKDQQLAKKDQQLAKKDQQLAKKDQQLAKKSIKKRRIKLRENEPRIQVTEEDEHPTYDKVVAEEEFIKEENITWSKTAMCRFVYRNRVLHEFKPEDNDAHENNIDTLVNLLIAMKNHNIITNEYFDNDSTYNTLNYEANYEEKERGFKWIPDLRISMQSKGSVAIRKQILDLVTKKGLTCDIISKMTEGEKKGEKIRFTKN